MTPDEAYDIRIVGEVVLWQKDTFFTQTWIENNQYRTAIFKNGSQSTRGNDTLIKVANDGIYFVRNQDGISKLMFMSEYAEPVELLTLGKIVKYDFHADGILIIGEEKKDNSGIFETKRHKFKFNGRGLLTSTQSLFLFNKEGLRKIVSGDFDVTDLATNGKRVVISATIEDNDRNLSNLYDVDLNSGELRKLTNEVGDVIAVAMNEKGEVAYLGHKNGLAPWSSNKLFLLDLGKEFMCGNNCGSKVLSDLFDSVKEKIIYKGDTIIAAGQTGGAVHLYQIDDKVTQLTSGNIVVRSFDYDGNSLAYVYSTPIKPTLLKSGSWEYDPNPALRAISPEEVIENKGWIIRTKRENPTILFIHGGPHMAYGYSYFIEFQFFALNGYNVAYYNPPGSQGYGEEYAKACVGDWGGSDMEELLNFLTTVREKYGLTGKVGVTGGSYGGYMTNWLITKVDIFSAAISERGISNLLSMCGTSDIGFWFNAVEAGVEDPWSTEGIAKLMKLSPITYVRNVKTPLLLIHGENDYRCPIEQAEQFYQGLVDQVDVKLVIYNEEDHEHARRGKPINMKDRLSKKLDWFDEHLKKN
ncbi:acylaminoacyl-peptidase [Sulfolobales archaeon HS-7]|nr:acylaminoacyl-peptidase [Sulfolobales archaeon HS-7]